MKSLLFPLWKYVLFLSIFEIDVVLHYSWSYLCIIASRGKNRVKIEKSTYSTTSKMKFSLLYLWRYVSFISLRAVWMYIFPSQQQLTSSNQPPLTRNPKAKGKVNLSFSLNASNFVIHKHFVGWQRERWMFPVSSTHWSILN